MKIVCIGGGAAGLYFALLFKKANPLAHVRVIERNPRGSTFGWGVVFSDGTLENLGKADPDTAIQINNNLNHWDDIEVHFKQRVIRSSGHGFCGIERKALLNILEERALQLGVEITFGQNVTDDREFKDATLIVGCDGIFSAVREKHAAQFQPHLDKRNCRYTWLGTRKKFKAFTFAFEKTPHGWFQAHCYRFNQDTSTFIVETPEEVWRKNGLDTKSGEESIAFCEKLFARYLDGNKLISNSTHLIGSAAWINFVRVHTERWHCRNSLGVPVVLLGDAAATAHFTVGSGTKLAMESAIALARWVSSEPEIESALQGYEQERRVEVLKLQNAARNSTEWFENVAQRVHMDPEQFAYSLLTRSQRVSHENLRVRDKKYLEGFERWLATRETGQAVRETYAPMFIPLTIRELTLKNRIVVSPMAMYSAADGCPSDFHLVHLGSLALGGAGLVFTEMTCVSPEARISPGCAGIYTEGHLEAWRRIVNFIHQHSEAKVALQLGHSGPKGSTKLAWEGMDEPLESGNWEVLAPSPIPYSPINQVPREMTIRDMHKVRDDFVQAAKRGAEIGFDMLELHFAHGYLLSSFISPLTNRRADEYGGKLEHRLRFPLEVFDAVRAAWPAQKPMSVRISAVDWVEGGNTAEDAVYIAHLFKEHGVDLMDVSSGQVSKDQKPVYGRMFQTPFADRIKNEVGIRTMAVGNIYEPDHANSIIAAGRADLCLLARPHLADPHWTLRAAAQVGYKEQWWPKQYDSAKRQLETIMERSKLV